jgi:hypothetical protein
MRKKHVYKLTGSIFLLISIAVGVWLTQTAVRYFAGAAGANANLVVDLQSDYGSSPDAWRNLAQGGEERGRWLLPVTNQVKALRPEYIRIDHVFDFYDQGQLDTIIRDIQAVGAKPFIALSYMPPSISRSGQVDDLPRDWKEWESRVQQLIERVSGRNGLAISNVYYEVWNEPDLFGRFKYSGPKNYLELYSHTAIAASRAGNTLPFKIGGPVTTGYYPNWMNALISHASKNRLRLDFVSWHRYSKNMNDYLKDITSARELLAKYNMQGREVIITEMGPNGDLDPAYDNYFGAIHAISTAVVLQDEVDRAFTFEIKDGPGPKQYWNRWGLYTHESHGTPQAKPRAHAMSFLNYMMGGTKMQVFGQGSSVRAMAKKISPTTMRILVVNYDPKGINAESVPITLGNITSPNFTFKRTDFLGGSKTEEVSTTSATWTTQQYFKPNSAAVFEINLK